jgi:hypothetical protein
MNAASTQKNTVASSGSRLGRQTHPTAATSTVAAPIQKSRDWLEPPLKKSAPKARPAAAAPKATGQRIAREANRAVGRIQESLTIVRTTWKWADPNRLQTAYK